MPKTHIDHDRGLDVVIYVSVGLFIESGEGRFNLKEALGGCLVTDRLKVGQ